MLSHTEYDLFFERKPQQRPSSIVYLDLWLTCIMPQVGCLQVLQWLYIKMSDTQKTLFYVGSEIYPFY